MGKSKTMSVLTALQRAGNPSQRPVYDESNVSYVGPEKMTPGQKIKALSDIRSKSKENSKETNANPGGPTEIEILSSRNPYMVE
jgi:hypothetical protein